jgi:RNA polymerase sigma factor (sigma-70 family)
MSARDDLIQQNAGLAFKAARRYRHICSIDDLEQTAMVGLIKAADTYDPDRVPPVKFSTYATRCILCELKALVRGQKPGDGLPDAVADTSASVERLLERSDLYHQLAHAIQGLSYVERVVLIERFGLAGAPVSRLELSMMTGICVDRIRAIEEVATEKLRAFMGVDSTDVWTSIQDN